MTYQELVDFLEHKMSMSHVYQPLLVRALVDAGGVATVRQLAQVFLVQDESQLLYYEKRIKEMPLKVLKRHTIKGYIEKRQQEEASNATINRELAALKRMFSLGMKATPPKVYRMPAIPRLKENNVRTGFLTIERYAKLADACTSVGLWLRAMLEVGYTFGWRVSEVKQLRVLQIDLQSNRILLDPGTTKNNEGRVVKYKPISILANLLAACCQGKQASDYVFTRNHRQGKNQPVRDFRGIWGRVCKEADCEGLLFHDLRRSAARNARASGVSEGVIMKMGGWKTRSVFERYAIVTERDMADAIERVEALRAQIGPSHPKNAPEVAQSDASQDRNLIQ